MASESGRIGKLRFGRPTPRRRRSRCAGSVLRLSRIDVTGIDDIRGWLTVVASRLCVDQVCSAQGPAAGPAEVNAHGQRSSRMPSGREAKNTATAAAICKNLRRAAGAISWLTSITPPGRR